MRTIFAFLVLAFFSQVVLSQDLIVTTSGDSINCKITKVKDENIYFTFKHKDEIRNTLLPLANVKNHVNYFFQKSEVPKDKVFTKQNFEHFRLAINGGLGYETARIGDGVPSDFKDYARQLKSGYVFGGNLTYYFSEVLGVGIKYSQFNSSNNLDNIYVDDGQGVRKYGRMSDDLSISFIGPTFSTRLFNGDKSRAFVFSLGLGYMGYSDNKVILDNYKMTGSTMGISYDIGYDFEVSKKAILGVQLSLISGTLFRYKWDDGTSVQTIKLQNDEYEGLSRIDLTVGLRFCK